VTFPRYWEIIDRVIQQNPVDAALGGDPSPANKVRAFLNVQYYKGGAWESRIEVRYLTIIMGEHLLKPYRQLISGRALWATIYYLIRTGHLREALSVSLEYEGPLNEHEELFTTYMKAWIDSVDRK
jgi:nuclear pore complex protein Nup93